MLHLFPCISSVISLCHPHPFRILIGPHYPLVSSTCLLSPIYYSFNSNGSLHTTSPERCALRGYCSFNFPQQDFLLISPQTIHMVLCITADYVLSFWSPPQGGFKSVLNNAAPAFYRYSTRRPLFELIRASSDPSIKSINTSSTVTTPTTSDHSTQLQLPLGDTHFESPDMHTHITPDGSDSEPRYITCDGSPIDSGTSPAFTTSPAFNTSRNITPFDPSTLADRLDIADLGQSFVNIPNPSDCIFPLHSAYWTLQTTMTPPPAPSVPSLPTPQLSASTNLTPDMSAISKIMSKPTVLQTIVPQIRSTNQKGKGKDTPGPDFHYQCPIEDKANAKKVFDHILDVSIPVTACELLSLSPDIRKQAKESTTTKKVKVAAFVGIDPVSQFLHSFDTCNCHEGLIVAKESHVLHSIIPIIDSCLPIKCILDSGCQIIGMSHAIWMMLKSQLNPKHTVSMQSTNGTVDRSLGIIKNLAFHFRMIELQLQVHIIKDSAYDILLGCPFDVLPESSIKNYRNEDQTITIMDPNDPSRVATMRAHPCRPPRFHAQKQ